MTAPLTDAELDEIERLVHTSCADDKAAAVACLVIVEKVPRLLAEVRAGRAVLASIQRERDLHAESCHRPDLLALLDDVVANLVGMSGHGCATGCTARQQLDDEPAGHLPDCLTTKMRTAIADAKPAVRHG